MKRKICSIILALVTVLTFSLLPMMVALAATAPSLGTAASFAVLGGGNVTLTTSTITGDVGLPSSGTLTNTGSTIIGTIHSGNATYTLANSDFYSAYAAVEAMSNGTLLTGTLAGVTLPPGNYYFSAAAAPTGTLTLNALGNPAAVWIIKVGTSGVGSLTGTSFTVNIVNGGSAGGVFWWVKDAATMTTSNIEGTILAGTDITITGGTSSARALAKGNITIGPGATLSSSSSSIPALPPGSATVGGVAYPINKANVLMPWLLIIPAALVIGGGILVLRRRTSR